MLIHRERQPHSGAPVDVRRAEADHGTSVRDAVALVRVAGGDEAALRQLVDRYGALVHGLALRALGDRGLAEECAQDVFERVWREAASYDPELARVGTWIMAITRHRIVDLARRRARSAAVPQADVEPAGESPDPAALVARSHAQQAVVEAMAQLPEPQLEVLRLAYFDGLSHGEIAARLDLPLGTVKGRLRLALERLRASTAVVAIGAEGAP